MNFDELFDLFYSCLEEDMSPPQIRWRSYECEIFWRARLGNALNIEWYKTWHPDSLSTLSYTNLATVFIKTFNAISMKGESTA